MLSEITISKHRCYLIRPWARERLQVEQCMLLITALIGDVSDIGRVTLRPKQGILYDEKTVLLFQGQASQLRQIWRIFQ